MSRSIRSAFAAYVAVLIMPMGWSYAADALPVPTDLGLFAAHADIGSVAKPGSVTYDSASGEYRIMGGGANMWSTNDAFHFLRKPVSGDFLLTADVRILGTAGNNHRKACLLVRQSLVPESAYADVVVHGDRLSALQWRDASGDRTYTIHSSVAAPPRLGLEKRGNYLSMWLAEKMVN